MVDFLLLAACAFVLFAVVLPLLGVILGLAGYYVLPYLFGGLLAVALGLLAGLKILLTWWVCLPAFAWASAVHVVRKKFRTFDADIEHHHAAHMILLAGIPYRRRKKQLLLLASD